MSIRALRSAASGMYAQQVNIEVISNNIANINTTGFKKNRAEFKDLIYQEVAANPQYSETPGVIEKSAERIQIGNGVQTGTAQKVFSQGTPEETTNPLDLAIQGEGFFQIRKPDGNYAYTRDGSFKISGDGSIVTSGGYVLDPGFTLNEDVSSISISKDGVIQVEDHSGDTYELGQIELAKFINPAGLKAIGDNLFVETPTSGIPLVGTPASSGYGEIAQGFLETSNVDIVEEMVSMITAQRAYETNSKTIKTVEEMMQLANNLKG
jgi:flagellar basal-body rod protein FlgG